MGDKQEEKDHPARPEWLEYDTETGMWRKKAAPPPPAAPAPPPPAEETAGGLTDEAEAGEGEG